MVATTSHRSDGAHDEDEPRTRQRRNTNKSTNSTGSGNDHGRQNRMHTGLGTAMYKIAEADDAARESMEKVASASK